LLVIAVSLLAGDDLIVLPNPRKLKAVSLEVAFNAARTIRAYPKTPSYPLRAFRGAVGSRRQAV
jgi:hypothetical protein